MVVSWLQLTRGKRLTNTWVLIWVDKGRVSLHVEQVLWKICACLVSFLCTSIHLALLNTVIIDICFVTGIIIKLQLYHVLRLLLRISLSIHLTSSTRQIQVQAFKLILLSAGIARISTLDHFDHRLLILFINRIVLVYLGNINRRYKFILSFLPVVVWLMVWSWCSTLDTGTWLSISV